MKICFATDNLVGYHKHWAGAEQACYRLGSLLIKDNQEIVFLTTKPDRNSGENLKVLGIPTFRSVLSNFFPFDLIAAAASYRALKKMKPDILHLHRFNELSLSLIWSAKKLGIPIVFSMYDFWLLCPKSNFINHQGKECAVSSGENCSFCYGSRNGLARIAQKLRILKLGFKLRKEIIGSYLKKIDAFIVLSDSWAKLLERYGVEKRKITVVPLPLMIEAKNKEDSTSANSILFVGWIYPHKGLHVLIEALFLIRQEVPDIKLYVVESGIDENYKFKIIERLKELKLEKNVSFLGKLPNEKVQELLRQAAAVVVPEQWGIAWPIFLTEAMAFGKPIVASKIGDIPEFIKDGQNGFLANPQDYAEFAKKIIWLLKDGRAKEMAERAREDILRICDEKKILEKLKVIYNSLG